MAVNFRTNEEAAAQVVRGIESAGGRAAAILADVERFRDGAGQSDDITLIVQASDVLNGTWRNLAQSVNGSAFTILTTGATLNETGSGNARSMTVGDLYQMTDPAHPHRFMRLQVIRP